MIFFISDHKSYEKIYILKENKLKKTNHTTVAANRPAEERLNWNQTKCLFVRQFQCHGRKIIPDEDDDVLDPDLKSCFRPHRGVQALQFLKVLELSACMLNNNARLLIMRLTGHEVDCRLVSPVALVPLNKGI